ncbi:MAG TPA: oligosaccharide flippase family protein [Bellilinea sp.]|nr:oligosaccharide flippase family protein [Bellilinea sp.]
MNFVSSAWKAIQEDNLLKKIIRNTGYMLTSTTVTMALSLVQTVVVLRILSGTEYGILGAITTFVTNVNRLFSFRMGEVIVKYMGEYLARDEEDRAAAILKLAMLSEAVTSLVTFVMLVIIAPLGAVLFAKDASFSSLFILFGFSILGNIINESSTGVLQVGGHFRSQAAINIGSSVLTMLVILLAYFGGGGLTVIVLAYMGGKLILGIGSAAFGLVRARDLLGSGWWKMPIRGLPSLRSLAKFSISSNLSQTMMMLVRDSEVLWISLLLSPLEAGYYKMALAIVNPVLNLTAPLIGTTFPEISALTAKKAWAQLRRLLRRVTLLSGSVISAMAVFLILFGQLILYWVKPEMLPAYTPMVILLIGLGFGNVFFWNRPLLLSLGLPEVPFRFTLIFGAVKILLTVFLVPRYGYVMEAILLGGFFICSVGGIVLLGYREIHRREINMELAV